MREREMILKRFTPERQQLIEKYSQETGTKIEKMADGDFIEALGLTPAEAKALGFSVEVKSNRQYEEDTQPKFDAVVKATSEAWWKPSETRTAHLPKNAAEEARNREREKNDREDGSKRANSHSRSTTLPKSE